MQEKSGPKWKKCKRDGNRPRYLPRNNICSINKLYTIPQSINKQLTTRNIQQEHKNQTEENDEIVE